MYQVGLLQALRGGSRIFNGHRSSAEGASIEVPQVPRGRFWGGDTPSPNGEGSVEGAHSPEIYFKVFYFGMVHFVCILTHD